ncbi:MAG: hypothetical protein GYA48_09675 [Chloroflexi bacterium]|nr:hypothetical protein [Chloroflexota bacterium]
MDSPAVAENSTYIYKTEFGIPIRNIWYMLMYAWGEALLNRFGDLDDVENAPTLDALLASILVKLIQQRMRIGLGRSYFDERLLLEGIRGRINFIDSLKHQTFERGQVFCDTHQFSLNVPKNQILRSTLDRLVQIGDFGPDIKMANELRHQIRWLTRQMEGIDLIELKQYSIHRQNLGRNDRDYQVMLFVCELIIQRHMPSDTDGDTRLPSIDKGALVMHRVYERFIASFYQYHLGGWKVTPQSRLKWFESNTSKYLPVMQPDLLLQEKNSGKIIILDTKFTAKSLVENQWGKAGFDSSHLYQLFTYLKTQEHLSEQHQKATGILLYPTIHQTNLTEEIGLHNLTIRIETVDLAAPWEKIEDQLLKILKN